MHTGATSHRHLPRALIAASGVAFVLAGTWAGWCAYVGVGLVLSVLAAELVASLSLRLFIWLSLLVITAVAVLQLDELAWALFGVFSGTFVLRLERIHEAEDSQSSEGVLDAHMHKGKSSDGRT